MSTTGESEHTSTASGSADITASFLSSIANQPVNIKLHNDFVYTGVLSSIDGYMNVVLQNASEIVNGKTMKTYDEVFLRGNNVIYI
ncbi:U4/U6-U5 snRNP complex subunit lsm6, partial [Pichia californica]